MRLFICLFLFSLSALAQKTTNTPYVSANALFLYRNSNFSKEDLSTVRNGLDIQETEIALYSDVDPYTRLNIVLAVKPEYEVNGSVVEQSWALEPEELFFESSQVPHVTLQAGKMKAAFGKHNELHTHAFPFVEAPLAQTQLLGEEGFNDVGVSGAVLLPSKWFSELSLQYFRGEGENTEFNSPSPSDGVYAVKWKNLWDLSEALTFELGASYAQGRNFLYGDTRLSGADMTFKWRPTQGGKFYSALLSVELIDRQLGQQTTQNQKGQGWNVWGEYQVAQRWAFSLRTESIKIQDSDPAITDLADISAQKNSIALSFRATEFSIYRLEYNQTSGPANVDGETMEKKLFLQANFTIGAHPAHSY